MWVETMLSSVFEAPRNELAMHKGLVRVQHSSIYSYSTERNTWQSMTEFTLNRIRKRRSTILQRLPIFTSYNSAVLLTSHSMSRRKAFDTSLSSGPAAPKAKIANNSSQQVAQKNRAPSISASLPSSVTPPDPAVGSATVPTETTEEKEEDAVKDNEEGEQEVVEDDGICFICAEPITFWSVGVCGHRTCQ